MQSKDPNNIAPSHYRNFGYPAPCLSAGELLTDLEETMVTKSYVSADVILKTAYFSLAAMAVLFVSLLLLTTLHP
jgi:hypothetical protein